MWCLRKYIFDIFLISIFSPFILTALTLVALLLILFDGRPIIFKSHRLGTNQKIFAMYKFRTMVLSAPIVETDLMGSPSSYITKFGGFLRTTSLDELPQLFNVIAGQMSLVGPRPALQSQAELNKARLERGISNYKPGITGLAQVKGRDNLSLQEKVFFDHSYCSSQSLVYDMVIIVSTFSRVLGRSNINH
jgi:O-antigen biosynthesis protein WbqP